MEKGFLRPLTGIAVATAREAIRQPALLLTTAISMIFVAALPFLITHILGDPARMILDSALAVLLMAGLLLGCQSASIAMSQEIQRGTLSSILSTPVDRVGYICAKFAGLAIAMLLYAGNVTLAILFAARSVESHARDWTGSGATFAVVLLALLVAAVRNFKSGTPFASAGCSALLMGMMIAHAFSRIAPGFADGTPPLTAWTILPVCANVTLAILLLTAIAMALSIRAGFIPVIVMTTGILMIGLMSDYIFGRHAAENTIAAILHSVIPNWQHFWTIDALHLGTIRWEYTAVVGLYTVIYGALVMAAGAFTLERMEIKK